MQRHFEVSLEELKRKTIGMGQTVASSVENAIRAFTLRDSELARQVIRDEKKVNRYEIEIDQLGRQMVALHQPLAGDLRAVVMILKMNTDLERMGDHAVNISERVFFLNDEPPIETNLHLREMAQAVLRMMRDSLKSFEENDVPLALSVLKADDVVDAYNDRLYHELGNLMEKDSLIARVGMNLFMIGHNLERIADLANNIAEDVVYMRRGEEVRHHLHSGNADS